MAASGGRKTASSTKKSTKSTASRSGKSGAKKKGTGRQAQSAQDGALFHEIGLIVLFALMVLLFCCNFGIIGPAGNAVSGFLFGLFGLTAYAAPVLLFLAAAFGFANEGNSSASRKLIAGIVLFVMAGIICDLTAGVSQGAEGYSLKLLYESSRDGKAGGGILGGSISYCLQHYLGTIGAVLVVLVCSTVCLILLTEKSLINSVKRGGSRVREISMEEAQRYREGARRWREDGERRREQAKVRRAEQEEQNRLRREEQEAQRSRREEARRLKAEEKENEKILRMEKKFSGVMLDTALSRPEEHTRRDDIHEITLPEEEMEEYGAPDAPGSASVDGGKRQEQEVHREEIPEEVSDEYQGSPVAEGGGAFSQWDVDELPIRIHKDGVEQDLVKTDTDAAGQGAESWPEAAGQEAGSWPETAGQEAESWPEGTGQGAGSWPETVGQEAGDWPEGTGQGAEEWPEAAGQGAEDWPEAAGQEAGNWPENARAESGAWEGENVPEPSAEQWGRGVAGTENAADAALDGGEDVSVSKEAVRNAARGTDQSEVDGRPGGVLHNAGEVPDNVRYNTGKVPDDVRYNTGEVPDDVQYNTGEVPDDVQYNMGKVPDNVHYNMEEMPGPGSTAVEEIPDTWNPPVGTAPERMRAGAQDRPDAPSGRDRGGYGYVQETGVRPRPEGIPGAAPGQNRIRPVAKPAAEPGDARAQMEFSREIAESIGAEKPAERAPRPYQFPPIDLLQKGVTATGDSIRELKETAVHLQQTLATFGVKVTITDISQGPSVTRYELQPEQGVKVSKIVGLADDIKLNLAALDIRIEAPIPGKAAIGIEVPNKESIPVMLRDLLETDEFRQFPSNVAFAVGKDIAGKVIVSDIAKMPHMLIAGATGSGKSVCINTLIMGILYKAHPDDVKLIMVDPKVVELSVYNGIPHLLIPVVTDPKKASAALHWGVAEMEDRYRKFAEHNVRDLKGYNKKVETLREKDPGSSLKKLPQIIIIVDELADLMMVCPGEVEESICRLAQLARAAGIHLIIATQRPSVDVITGLIKANMPSRVAFSVSSGVDSRTILDVVGAEKLLGKGDMLFYPQGYPKPARVQGAFVSDNEVSEVVDFLKNQALGNTYAAEIEEKIKNIGSSAGGGASGGGVDDLFEKAGRLIIDKDKASIGMLQRALQIGFNRAARIMDQLCDYGVVGNEEGTKPRKILMSPEQFEQLLEEI